MVRNYIDWILSLPWYEKTKDKIDIDEATRVLDEPSRPGKAQRAHYRVPTDQGRREGGGDRDENRPLSNSEIAQRMARTEDF